MNKRYVLLNDKIIEDIVAEKTLDISGAVDELNRLEEYRQNKKSDVAELESINDMCFDVIGAIESYFALKSMGLLG